jgi:pyridoxal phosphate enzyme (YggS family)
MSESSSIDDNLAIVRSRIEAAATGAGRNPKSITLIAVSKTHPAASVEAAILAGQRVFGENRVQEAERKFRLLKERHPDLALHLIGPLQTNKVKQAVALFDAIHSVDRVKLADMLASEMRAQGKRLSCFVEVNIAQEPQKSGIAPADADAFLAACKERYGLPVAGLMCIPPADEDPAPHFVRLAALARRCGVSCLSMGMSADYETAIKAGATHIRVGNALFGPRAGHCLDDNQSPPP